MSNRVIYFLSSIIMMLMAFYCPATSQQLPRFSQYFSNEFIVNPAVAGYDGRTVVNLAARKQWLGFSEYTPNSYALSLEGRILKKTMSVRGGFGGSGFRKSTKGRIGLGGLVYHDVNGAIERTGGQFSYAYHIFINNAQLSFGLTGNVFQYRIDAEKARLKNPDIDVLNGLIGKSTLIPDANVGVNYMTEKYHIGVAACQLFQSKIKVGNGSDFKESEETRLLRQYYILGDYMFTSRRQWEWQPSMLLVLSEKPQIQAEATLKAYYNRQYWFGISGRTSGDIVIMAGLKLLKYYFGYSYDYGFNGISRYTFGSHEICITAKFGDTARRYRWLDRY